MAAGMHSDHDSLVSAYSLQMALSTLNRQPSRGSPTHSTHRPSRIEKPKSNHNSPRPLERRKTTSGTKRYATLDDHFNMMFGAGADENAVDDYTESARPVSWHPSSSQFQVPNRLSVQESNRPALSPSSARHSTHGSDYYSLSPLHQTPAIPSFSRKRSSDSDESSQQTSRYSYALSSYSTPSTEPWYLQEWTRKTEAASTPSERVSSDFLPIQRPSVDQDGDSSMEEDEEPKELVGMGLYDGPDVSSLGWGSSALEGTGKGLKLEETWQPPENQDEDEDEDADADDASSDDGSVEELPSKEESKVLPVPTKPKLSPNMEGQSFFFDEEESYTKEWWYQQLKQPTVRATGLAYDWL